MKKIRTWIHRVSAGNKLINFIQNDHMKKILAVICFIIIAYGCKNAILGSPKSTVASFIEAAKTGDLDQVKKYITKSDAGLIELGQRMISNFDPARAKEMKD